MRVARFLSGLVAIAMGILCFVLLKKHDEEWMFIYMLVPIASDAILGAILAGPLKLRLIKGFRIANAIIGALFLLFILVKPLIMVALLAATFWMIPVFIMWIKEAQRGKGIENIVGVLLKIVVFAFYVGYFLYIVDIRVLRDYYDYFIYAIAGLLILRGLLGMIFAFVKEKAKDAPKEEKAEPAKEPEAVEAPASEPVEEAPVEEAPAEEQEHEAEQPAE